MTVTTTTEAMYSVILAAAMAAHKSTGGLRAAIAAAFEAVAAESATAEERDHWLAVARDIAG